MIRDPSDGSVREKREVEHQQQPLISKGLLPEKPLLSTSALAPAPKDAKETARLEKARKFVRDYHAGKVIRSPEQGEG